MLLGVIYWGVWRVVLPKMFGYELVPNKVVLDDGTVVVVVRFFLFYNFFWMYGSPIHLFFLKINSLDELKNGINCNICLRLIIITLVNSYCKCLVKLLN